MREAIERRHPGEFEVEVRDIYREYGFDGFDRRHKFVWRWALRNPWSIVLVQHMIDASPPITNFILQRLQRRFAREAARRLRAERPALVVTNHGWAAVAFTMVRERFGLDVPLLVFETSTLNANALWAEPRAERFLVASGVSKRRLARLGVPESRIDVVGYPVRQAFFAVTEKNEARRRLGLADAFTCLISLGGEGLGVAAEAVVSALHRAAGDMQIVAIAGRNWGLYRRLCAMRASVPGLVVRGFVEDMASHVAACDVVVGKSGPAATYEVLAVGRPMIVPTLSGLVENKMLRVLAHSGLGAYRPGLQELAAEVLRYRDDPALLEEVRRKTAAIDFPGMAGRLADYIVHYAKERTPLRSACGRGLSFLASAVGRSV